MKTRAADTGVAAPGRSGAAARLLETLAWAGIALLPLACWPDLANAFSTPKLGLILCLDLIVAALLWTRRKYVTGACSWPALAWVAAVSVSALMSPGAGFEALLLALAPAPLFWLCAGGPGTAAPLARAIAAGSAIESALALLQYANADPLRLLGWQAETFPAARMRVYGTLGNPDFVAAWCCATLPVVYFVLVESARTKSAAVFGRMMVAAQLAAILCSGSRAALPVLAAQAIILAICRGHASKKWLAIAPLAALVLLPGSRSIGETVRGRLFLARVSLSQAGEIPVTGYGPGSFESQFARREVEWFRAHGTGDARFAGPVDHAHNDYAEFLVEYGPLGLCAFLTVCWQIAVGAARLRTGARFSLPARPPRRSREATNQDGKAKACPTTSYSAASGFAVAAAAGLAGLAALGFIDFPFHRPAEWALFWLLAGAVVQGSSGPTHPVQVQAQEGDT